MSKRKTKVCLACSPGGHFHQLRLATANLPSDGYEYYWLMYKAPHLTDFFKDKRLVTLTNTDVRRKWTFAINAIQSLWYLFKERPDVIISSGAGVAYPTMLFGKWFFGCKIIFLCSAANVRNPSRVPLRIYKHSDLFLIQWPELFEFFPKATYIGVL